MKKLKILKNYVTIGVVKYHKWRNADVMVYCDNMAVVNAFQNDRIRDP